MYELMVQSVTMWWSKELLLLQYYSVLQSTTPVLPVLASTTLYYKALLRYYSVLESSTTYYCSVLLRTTKYYSSTILCYKVLLQYYSVLQSITPVLFCTTKYYASTTKYYASTTKYHSVQFVIFLHFNEKFGKSVFSLTSLREGLRLRSTWHASSAQKKTSTTLYNKSTPVLHRYYTALLRYPSYYNVQLHTTTYYNVLPYSSTTLYSLIQCSTPVLL